MHILQRRYKYKDEFAYHGGPLGLGRGPRSVISVVIHFRLIYYNNLNLILTNMNSI